MKDVLENSLLVKNKQNNYPLFELNKSCDYKFYKKNDNKYILKVINDELVKPFLGYVNRIFNNYGFCIKYERSAITKMKIKNRVVLYKIDFNDGINKYL